MHYGPPTDDVKLKLVPYHYQAKGLGRSVVPTRTKAKQPVTTY